MTVGLLWMGLFLISMSWNFFVDFYGAEDHRKGAIALGAGVFLVGLWWWRNRAVGATPLSPPRSSGPCDRRIKGVISSLLTTCLFLLLVLIVQAGITDAYPSIHARCYRLYPFSWFGSILLRCIGVKSFVGEGILFVKSRDYLLEFTPEMGKIGVYPWLVFMAAVTLGTLFICRTGLGRTLVSLWVAAVVYLFVRYAAMAAIYASFHEVLKTANLAIFWHPTIVGISFLPLVLFILAASRISRGWQPLDARELKPGVPTWIAAALALLGLFSYSCYWGYRDPGIEKQGRILFDDSYSGEWEIAGRRFDKEWYGDLSVYNYSSLAQWMRHYYPVDINEKKPLTRELISRYDILVIKTPTKRFSKQEVEDIQAFVREGGGLFIISDHTNLMGMSAFSNEILEPMGLRFKYDGVNGLNGGFSFYERPFLNAHPAIAKAEYFEYLTSCSIDAPLTAEDVMVVPNNQSDRMDYSNNSFFGDFAKSPDDDFGPLVLATAMPYGKGRVLAFSDSTTFNTFTLFMHGHSEFFKGSIEYLNRQNSPALRMKPYLLGLAIISILTGVGMIVVHRTASGLIFSIFAGFIGVVGGKVFCEHLARAAYPDRREFEPIVRVNVLWEKSRYCAQTAGVRHAEAIV